MAPLMGKILGSISGKLNDNVAANNLMSGSRALAVAYFNASLETTTPELRSLLFNSAAANSQAHAMYIELALKKGWIAPYKPPVEQLKDSLAYSQTFTQENA